MTAGRWLVLVALLAAVTIPLQRGQCLLEGASVEHVPPQTILTRATYQCGGITCWERRIETTGMPPKVSVLCAGSTTQGEELKIYRDWPE